MAPRGKRPCRGFSATPRIDRFLHLLDASAAEGGDEGMALAAKRQGGLTLIATCSRRHTPSATGLHQLQGPDKRTDPSGGSGRFSIGCAPFGQFQDRSMSPEVVGMSGCSREATALKRLSYTRPGCCANDFHGNKSCPATKPPIERRRSHHHERLNGRAKTRRPRCHRHRSRALRGARRRPPRWRSPPLGTPPDD